MNAILQLPPPDRPTTPPPLEPPRFCTLADTRSGTAAPVTFGMSLLVHAGLVATILVLPLFSDEILTPASGLRAFFAAPPAITPPPPPPAPPALPAAVRSAVVPARQPTAVPDSAFRAPIEIPEVVVPEEPALDLGTSEGVEGGVEGGVPGGVVGGIVGGLAEAVPTPPRILRIGGNVKPPRLLHRVEPVYPPVARQARIAGKITIDAIVGQDGRVRETRVVSGAPLLSEAAVEAVRQWRYEPQLLNGVPVDFELLVTVTFVLVSQ